MNTQVSRLEQALGLWEDVCSLYGLLARLSDAAAARGVTFKIDEQKPPPYEGPFQHCRSFRKRLRKETTSEFDHKKYRGSASVVELLGPLGEIPFQVWSWVQCSRRSYQLSPEYQLFLDHQEMENVYWGDLVLPTATFAIILSDPLLNGLTRNSYDVLLVNTRKELTTRTGEAKDFMVISALYQELADYQFPGRSIAAEYENNIEDTAGNDQHLYDAIQKIGDALNESSRLRPASIRVDMSRRWDDFLVRNEDLVREEDHSGLLLPMWRRKARYLVGVGKYVASLKKEAAKPHWQRYDALGGAEEIVHRARILPIPLPL